ncbi:MAG: hypothetical protein HQ559_09420 [Lentisphaerae bacterium]|nr:hypothetical protein [Lentisphaerota bacterium]
MPTAQNLILTDEQLEHFESVYARYRLVHEDPANCTPMITVAVAPWWTSEKPTWEEQLADPMVMLEDHLGAIRSCLEIGDDGVPVIRVDFGTAQVPAAFGCELGIPENNTPAARTHSLKNIQDVYALEKPPLDAGWYGKLDEWTALWLEHLPKGVHIQHPDIQSAFNSALLIRGSDLLMDMYDDPEAVGALLDLVTDFMIDMTRHVREAITDDPDWFFDWGCLWKGSARISNCSMHMISAEFYREQVLPRDIRFMEAMGGGRIHYCGSQGEVIDDFCTIPSLTGLDIDVGCHDPFEVCERLPEHVVLHINPPVGSPVMERLLAGDWPKKRNLIVGAWAPSLEEGRELLGWVRKSVP